MSEHGKPTRDVNLIISVEWAGSGFLWAWHAVTCDLRAQCGLASHSCTHSWDQITQVTNSIHAIWLQAQHTDLAYAFALQGLTPECTDMMSRLLEVDPDKRITVPDVLKHPWFVQELPEGMANLNYSLLQIPLSLQSGTCRQSEEEIVEITTTAIQGSKASRGLSYGASGLGASSGVSLE